MNAFIQQLLLLSLSGTFSILLIRILKKLYQNHFSKRWQYYIWLLAIVRFLFPLAPDTKVFSMLIGTGRVQAENPQMGSTYNLPADSLVDGQMLDAGNLQAEDDKVDAGNLQAEDDKASLFATVVRCLPAGILATWLVLAVCMFARRISAYRRFMHDLCSAGTAVSDSRLLRLFAVCRKACGVTKPVALYQIPQLTSPVMAGLFHPCIAIPGHSFSDEELSFIFLHELTHYRQRDLIYKWLIQAAVCIHWFNPFVYFLEKEVNNACELACDESVIRFLPKEAKKAYGDTLLLCSKTAYQQKSSGLSLALTEGAQLLKERLGAIMNYRQLTKKTKIATIIITAGICFGSAAFGAYAAPSDPAYFKQAGSQTGERANKSTAVRLDSQPDGPFSKYQELLAFRTDSYQKLTVAQFREKVATALDTPDGISLLDEMFRDEEVHLHRFDHEDAFFLQNTLILATGTWRKNNLSAVGVERPLKNGQTAELEFRAEIRLLNKNISVSEYEAAYRGLADTAAGFLNAKTEAELMDASSKSTKKLSKEAQEAMQAYARKISKKENIAVAVDFCCYAPEDHTPGDDVPKLPARIKKILTLKTKDYKNYTLQQFSDYISEQYGADEALWKASQGYWNLLDEKTVRKLSGDEYTFLTVTLPCTTSESTYPHDRVGNIPPGFGGRYDLPYKKHNTKIHFEWHVQYEIQNPNLTIGERDRLISNVINGMDQFMEHTPDTIDIGTEAYMKKMRSHLEQMVKENSGSGLEMAVIQCQGG